MHADFSGLGFQVSDVAVVTGAANGIGRAAAVMLAAAGVTVAIWDREEDPLRELSREIGSTGGKAHPVVVDLQEPEGIDSAWAATGALGSVRYLVNNAGPPASADLSTAEGVRLAVGIYAGVTERWLALHGSAAASVTFTASVAGTLTFSSSVPAWYPTAKAGIVGYMKSLAVHYRGHPRSNAVAPGVTVTRRTAERLASPVAQQRMKDQVMGRPADPAEIAAAICFLLSPAADFVNGVSIPVDGGSCLLSP